MKPQFLLLFTMHSSLPDSATGTNIRNTNKRTKILACEGKPARKKWLDLCSQRGRSEGMWFPA